ncbi:hypothetical protein CPC08DRAFT_729276 [Agrocybe pediades]|nr:hypothetical protein CPC08DRAFT_729276 [Agrocybe pediades]
MWSVPPMPSIVGDKLNAFLGIKLIDAMQTFIFPAFATQFSSAMMRVGWGGGAGVRHEADRGYEGCRNVSLRSWMRALTVSEVHQRKDPRSKLGLIPYPDRSTGRIGHSELGRDHHFLYGAGGQAMCVWMVVFSEGKAGVGDVTSYNRSLLWLDLNCGFPIRRPSTDNQFLVAWLPVPADPGDRILHPATPLRLYPSTRPILVEQI